MSDYPMLISNKLHSFRNFCIAILRRMHHFYGRNSRIKWGENYQLIVFGWSIDSFQVLYQNVIGLG